MHFHRQNRPKLSKTRSSDTTAKLASRDAYVNANHSRTSSSDLKTSARSSLPRQSTAPENIGTAADLPPISKNRLARVASASASDVDAGLGTSPTTVNSPDCKKVASGASMEPQRSPGLPTLPGSVSNVDVERAINLLQELKKTASPEELVSLHKALLPTKEVSAVPPPQLSSVEEHVAFSALSGRARSARPPGLATRCSVLDDPLRSQAEVAVKPVRSQDAGDSHGAWFQETMSAVHARTCSMTSTGTAPDSSYTRTGGAYGLGTLRVTNGRPASPAPSVSTKPADGPDDSKASEQPARRSEEAPEPALELTQRFSTNQRRHSQDSIASTSALSLAQRRQQQWGLRNMRQVPLLSSIGQEQEPQSEEARHDQHQASSSNHRQDTTNVPSALRVATDVPRYEQRWTRRTRHLSYEYMFDYDISLCPHNNQVHELPECAKRLSTVKDNDAEDSPDISGAADACARALLKLTGGSPSEASQAGSAIKSAPETNANMEDDDADVAKFPRFSFDAILNPPQAIPKQDSGHRSQISNSTSNHTSSSGSKKSTAQDATLERTPEVLPNRSADATNPTKSTQLQDRTTVPTAAEPLDDASTAKTRGNVTIRQNEAQSVEPKKRLSRLAIFKPRNRASKCNSITVDTAPPTPKFNDPPPISSSTQGKRGVSPKPPADKRRRTLQKRIPEPVRQKRGEVHKARQCMDVSQVTEIEPTTDASTGTPDQLRTVIKHVPLARNADDADDELSAGASSTAKSSRSWGRRSKSFARRRSKTIQEEEHEDTSPSLVPETTPERRRSRSLAGPGVQLSKRTSMDATTQVSCIKSNSHTNTKPTHPDSTSMARSLEAPRQSAEAKPTSTMPWVTRKGSLCNKNGGRSPGRATASRSQATAPAATQPATATSEKTVVQDLYPEWQSKPASEASLPAAQEAKIANVGLPVTTHRSVSEAIPSLPELPADIDSMLCKADLKMAKNLKNSPKTSPRGSARDSVDSGGRHRMAGSPTRGGPGQDLSSPLFAQTVVGEPPIVEAPSDNELPAEVDGTPLHRRQSRAEPPAQPSHAAAKARSQSPTHDAQHSGWPGWEQQSARWRERASIAGDAVELPCEDIASPTRSESRCDSPASPPIVVSRYITPFSSETATRRSNSAHKRSSTIQVIERRASDSDKEHDVSAGVPPRSNSVVSTETYVTLTSSSEGRPARSEVSRTDSAFSHTTSARSEVSRTDSAFSHSTSARSEVSRTDSTFSLATSTTSTTRTSFYSGGESSATTFAALGSRNASQVSLHSKYMPYRPVNSVHAERSRALNRARQSCQLKPFDVESVPSDHHPGRPRRASTDVFDRYIVAD